MNKTTIPKILNLQNSVFLNDYIPSTIAFDELKQECNIRPHWELFVRSLEKLQPSEFLRRWSEARQQLRLNGVTYNLHSDSRGVDRPWQLDPIPLLISENEESHIQKGLIQRAILLEIILKDLYGPRTLIKNKLISPELIYSNPNFLRACNGFKPAGNRYLYMVAVDLARGPSGVFHAISDRTQAPSGPGYALENRIVMTQMLPEIFNKCNVQRLAMFFGSFKETLKSISPFNKDNPRTVLLTAGPRSETYFEHAYLARYLGITLVEGGDLTVRNNRVYLKLLDGLQPVDVIMRRLDDRFCDPLELQSTSLLGVPGLVQCARRGGVAIANALGCSIVESPILMPFLPYLAKTLLGEELIIPGVTSYWCGNTESLKYVFNNLDNIVLKTAFSSRRMEPIFIEELAKAQREELIESLIKNPQNYIAQERIELSTAPVLTEKGIQARPLVLRRFLCAQEDSFLNMPGGLCRYASSTSMRLVSVQQGGGSKDTWVLTSDQVSTFSLLKSGSENMEISRGGGDLPSRAADNLFWLGRYTERTEGLARLLRGIFLKLLESSKTNEGSEVHSLLKILTHCTKTFPGFTSDITTSSLLEPIPELLSMVYDRDRPGTFAYDLQSIYRTASSSRDRISFDMWRVISTLEIPENSHLNLDGFHQEGSANIIDILEVLNRNIIILSAFGGLAAESMTRGHAWRFLDIGRKIERAFQTIRLLNGSMISSTNTDIPLYESILEIADSLMTFRRRYFNKISPAAVLDLLFADPSNPRSLVFQLNSIRENMALFPNNQGLGRMSLQEKSILSTLTTVLLADLEHLIRPAENKNREYLRLLLSNLECDLSNLADSISHHYLSHLQLSRHLSGNNQ